MNINQDKLTPAPWIAWRREQQTTSDQPSHGSLETLSGPVKCIVQLDHAVGLDPDFAAFAALARNALDIMMRRGWFPIRNQFGWKVFQLLIGDIGPRSVIPPAFERIGDVDTYEYHTNPFTALVEADSWYTGHVK